MELQFHKSQHPYMQRVLRQVQEQEQTQQLRLNDQMPDVGKILGCWGQVLIRGKEWNGDSMQLSGGVMVWALYQPEDGSAAQHLEGWVPFQMKWEFAEAQRDGIMRICPLLRSVDARAVSARKLMVRCNLSVCAEAYVSDSAVCYRTDELAEDVQVLQRQYPMKLSVEAGEKPFTLEEELSLPGSCEAMEKLLCYWIRPELIEKKVMGDKAVFRGGIGVHLMYLGADQRVHTWDFDVPFSQYTELEQTYGHEADMDIWLAPTSMELEMSAEGKLLLKVGMTGQYLIYNTVVLDVVEDAYSTKRAVEPVWESMQIPAILEMKGQTTCVEQNMGVDGSFVDAAILLAQPHMMRIEEGWEAQLECGVQMLYYDEDGQLQSAFKRWEEMLQIKCAEDAAVDLHLQPTGKTQLQVSTDGLSITADLLIDTVTVTRQGVSAVTGLQLGEMIPPDPGRPSMILRRLDEDGLWKLAKTSGSTVDAIRKANNLTAEPEPGKLLLIPVS